MPSSSFVVWVFQFNLKSTVNPNDMMNNLFRGIESAIKEKGRF